MTLKCTAIKAAKPQDKQYKLADEKGMYLLIMPNGSKYFRFNYRIHGKRKTLPLGVYPDISLKQAREKRDTARHQIAEGIDPMATKKTESKLFTDIALKWFKSKQHSIDEKTHIKKLRRFELHVFPIIGHLAIGDVKSPDVFDVVRPLVDRLKIDTAHRLRAEISEIYAYAIAHGYTEYDPAQAVAKQIPAHKAKHRAALTEPKEVAQLLRDIYAYEGTFIVQQALRITPLLFQRPGEIRKMLWQDVDLDAKEWRYLVTKTKIQHIVPLSDQAIKIFKELKQVTGNQHYVFPSSRNDGRPMSDNAVRTALRTLGYGNEDMSPHGFRTTASTLLNEQGWSPDAIERQLSHMPKDQVRAAYNRAQYLDERRKLMQSWANYLDQLKSGSNVIPFKRVL
ncbi:integrase [Methyloprofundus sedimenti]|uniref:Integrase n=1 Tax=Methyloprofundus sedimenti TaxID=1420851 RepID=A0A1V8M8T3_9GAMM|nr:integrase arm-type DNA-binding domain-containing protein [Methyloprofundus sedimenti]OQK18004.1 integrase [Methyloprofundus sedimenti]